MSQPADPPWLFLFHEGEHENLRQTWKSIHDLCEWADADIRQPDFGDVIRKRVDGILRSAEKIGNRIVKIQYERGSDRE